MIWLWKEYWYVTSTSVRIKNLQQIILKNILNKWYDQLQSTASQDFIYPNTCFAYLFIYYFFVFVYCFLYGKYILFLLSDRILVSVYARGSSKFWETFVSTNQIFPKSLKFVSRSLEELQMKKALRLVLQTRFMQFIHTHSFIFLLIFVKAHFTTCLLHIHSLILLFIFSFIRNGGLGLNPTSDTMC